MQEVMSSITFRVSQGHFAKRTGYAILTVDEPDGDKMVAGFSERFTEEGGDAQNKSCQAGDPNMKDK